MIEMRWRSLLKDKKSVMFNIEIISSIWKKFKEGKCSVVYEGVSKITRTDAVKIINLTIKRVWKLPTSTQLRTW
jgi:serine/threonine-protein kinase RIO1